MIIVNLTTQVNPLDYYFFLSLPAAYVEVKKEKVKSTDDLVVFVLLTHGCTCCCKKKKK